MTVMTTLLLVANAGDGTISTLLVDVEAGDAGLSTLATSPVGTGVNTFAVDAGADLVYATVKGDPAAVVTLRLDRGTGRLVEVSRRAVDGAPTYLALTRGGSVLLGASYGGGFGMTWPVTDGVVGAPTSRVEAAHPHCLVAEGDDAYLVALGEDRIAQFRLDGAGGLIPRSPASAAAPAGSGPRHLLVEPPHAYLVTEYSAEAIRYDVGGDGTLTPAERVRIDDPAAGLRRSDAAASPPGDRVRWGADVHRAGGFLLCSERTASTIATIALTPRGRLGEVVALTRTETQPRGFVVLSDGGHVLVLGERSGHAALLRLEPDGTLTLKHREPVGAEPNWVRCVER